MGINVFIINILLFNIGWLGCVLGGSTVALPLTIAISWIHFSFVSGERGEAGFLAVVTLLGVLVDALFFQFGVLALTAGDDTLLQASAIAPLWMVCLWWLFATTLNHSLQWLQAHPWLALVLGALAGPSSYLAGSRLSDVAIGEPLAVSLAVLVIVWAAILPAVMQIAKGFRQRWQYA